MKRCTRCKQDKSNEDFHRDSSTSDGLMTRCKKCRKETAKRNREAEKRWYSLNRERLIEYGKARYRCDKKHAKELARESHRRAIRNLSDSYIRSKLTQGTSLRRHEVPQILVEIQRIKLSIKREIKEMEE